MSHNDPLPPELTDLEEQLSSLPLPSARLSREATLYQCGWAAAEAHLRGQQWRRGWIWQASSGVLAASVVVLAVLLVRQDAARQVAVKDEAVTTTTESALVENAIVEQAHAARPSTPTRPLPFSDFGSRFAPDDRSMLAVRERALRGVFVDPTYTAGQGNASLGQPKTRRELLNELLKRSINS